MTDELAKCPFCGGKATMHRREKSCGPGRTTNEYWIACDGCMIRTDFYHYTSKESLPAAWNARAESAENALADELRRCDWKPGNEFEFADDPGEHDPCYVVLPDRAMLSLNHHAMPGVDIARAKFIIAACNAALRRQAQQPDEEEEIYSIGKRDGYEEAIQEIDMKTGGDGEFKGSTFPGETVDVPVMKQRILDRFSEQQPDEWRDISGLDDDVIAILTDGRRRWFGTKNDTFHELFMNIDRDNGVEHTPATHFLYQTDLPPLPAPPAER